MSNTVINTNVSALNSHGALLGVSNRQARSSERLSSGLRINRAADDAAGLTISEKMRSQIRGFDQAIRNSQDGISLIQTAEGGLQEIQDMGQRIRELRVQRENGTLETADTDAIDAEIDQLVDEIEDIVSRTTFNGQVLLDGNLTIDIQNGAFDGETLEIDIDDALAEIVDSSSDLEDIDSFLEDISTIRSNLGALQNRLEHTINNLRTSSENTSSAESRIRDTDMAREMMQLTQANVLQQAATSMLAQANQAPQGVLQLLN